MKGLLKLAKSDYKYAKLAYSELKISSDSADLNICAYHTQQCVEKLLKYMLEKSGYIYDRTYDITVLIDACAEHNLPIPELIESMSHTITTWATQSRYNSEFKTSIRSLEKILRICGTWLDEFNIAKVEISQVLDDLI